MNTERIHRAKDGIGGYLKQIDNLIQARTFLEQGIEAFLTVNPHMRERKAHDMNLLNMKQMLADMKTHIFVAESRIKNLKRLIDEEINGDE